MLLLGKDLGLKARLRLAGFIREAPCPYNAGMVDETAMLEAGFVNVNIDKRS
jgi:hypothetical protein